MNNPLGLHWKHASVNAARHIVLRLRDLLTELGVPVLLGLDEDDNGGRDCEPDNLVVVHRGGTALVPLQFRKHTVRVGDKVVYVAHDDGALMLMRELVRAVERACTGTVNCSDQRA
jgi:hypothetical protein